MSSRSAFAYPAARIAPGGHIEVALSPGAGAMRVDVADSGCGIDSGLLPTLFERHTGDQDGGAGLGLGVGLVIAIVKRILDLHDSIITVTSTPGSAHASRFACARELMSACSILER